MITPFWKTLCHALVFAALSAQAQEKTKVTTHSDLLFATVGGQSLRLNLFIPHGEKDSTDFLDQSERIRDAYQSAGLPFEYYSIKNGKHGGEVYISGENRVRGIQFFKEHLAPQTP